MRPMRIFLVTALMAVTLSSLLVNAGCTSTSQSPSFVPAGTSSQESGATMPGQVGPGGPGGRGNMDGQAPPEGQAPPQGGLNIIETACEILGLTPDELMERTQEGTSLIDIAEEQGLSYEEFKDALLAAMTANIEQQVSEGTITREQADEILQRMQKMIESGMEQDPFMGPRGGGHPELPPQGQTQE